MNTLNLIVRTVMMMLGIMMFAQGCVVAEPHEGYWDRDHHRYYHEHAWVECGPGDVHCR